MDELLLDFKAAQTVIPSAARTLSTNVAQAQGFHFSTIFGSPILHGMIVLTPVQARPIVMIGTFQVA
ncbi:hypothetical protein FS763_22770 [Agrobacterium vitis]|uniref:hypothetical protein n=1 Tax=Allorhizobium ampelinum TaxID=3025782 RepID=UPI001F16E916|nr:hypothetical protein [Allorhizobium ampelinum]MCF1474747.1 hypothetical protein [Allorhizobium ampelinum]